MIGNTKECPKCRQIKDLEQFHSCKIRKDGKQTYCIDCRRTIIREYKRKKYQTDPEYRFRTYETSRRSRAKNPKRIIYYQKQYYQTNKNKIKIYHEKWRKINKNKLRIYWNSYRKNRKINDLEFKILCNLQCRLWFALKAKKVHKLFKTMALVGCTIPELKAHLQSKFLNRMSWQNYGDWHIDHIKPCASFDLSIPQKQQECFHFSNLQPLWATTEIARSYGDNFSIGNIEKGNSISCYQNGNLSP